MCFQTEKKKKKVLKGVFHFGIFLSEAHGKEGCWFLTFVPCLFLSLPFVSKPGFDSV